MAVTFVCIGLEALVSRFGAVATNLETLLQPATALIEDRARMNVEDLYGPKLSPYWTYEQGLAPGAAASIKFGTDEPKVLWWEYGTNPHPIRPVRAQVLHFIVNGDEVFTKYVNHPGQPAHNQRDTMTQRMVEFAGDCWLAAIREALAAL